MINKLICFISGTCIGGLTGWAIAKHAYTKKLDGEVKKIRKDYEEPEEEEKEEEEKEPETEEEQTKLMDRIKEEKRQAIKIIQKNNYSGYFKPEVQEEKKRKEEEKEMMPYCIAEDDFEENNGFAKESISFYMVDEVFTDLDGNVIDNGLDLVGGLDNLHLSEDDDVDIYIRNPRTETDYEIFIQVGAFYKD